MKYIAKKTFDILLLLMTFSVIWLSAFCYNALNENEVTLDAHLFFQKGIKYGKKTDIKSAFRFFSDAIKEDPDFAWAYIERAKINHFTLKKSKNSISDLTKAIDLMPDSYDAYIYRGIVFLKTGEYDKAIADFNNALEIYPYSSVAYLNKADIYHYKNDYSKALTAYKSVLHLYPENKDAILGRKHLAHSIIKSTNK